MRLNAFLTKQDIYGPVVQIKEIGYNKIDDFGILYRDIPSYITILDFYENGKPKGQTSIDSYGDVYGYEIQTFNENGSQITSNDYNEKGELEESTVLIYDIHNHLVKNTTTIFSEDEDESKKGEYMFEHEYSEEGTLISTITFDKNNEPYNQVFFKYDMNGKIVCEETCTIENRVIESYVSKYDDFQRLIERRYIFYEAIYPEGEPSDKALKPIDYIKKEDITTYVHDEFGNCIEQKNLQHDGTFTLEKNFYQNNQLIESEVSNFDAQGKLRDDRHFLNRARRVTKFKKNEGVTESKEYMADGKLKHKYHIETKYDEYFNNIEDQHFTDDKLVSVQVYEIKYK